MERGEMRIAFVYDAVYPYVKGGGEKRLFLFARELAKRHEVHIFGMRWWSGPAVFRREGITYHGVCKAIPLYAKGRRSLVEPAYFALFLAPALWKYDFDVVDCQSFPFMPAFVCKAYAVGKRKNLVVTWYEFWGRYWLQYLGVLGVVGMGMERGVLALTKNHGAISCATQKKLPVRSVLFPMGIAEASFVHIPSAQEKIDVLFVGRLIKEKNIPLILGALELFSDISCGIVGDGPERRMLEQQCLVRGLRGRVRFFGFLPEEKVVALMKSAKVFILPSMREGFGLAALEALACGCPVIALKQSSIADFVENGVNGFLCDPNPESLAEKIRLVVTGKENEGLRKRAIASALQFDVKVEAKRMEEFYRSLG